MREFLVYLTKAAVLAVFFLPSTLATAQTDIASSDVFVTTADSIAIHVHHKIGAQPNKVPVLLIHGTWGDARTWDFPGRSIMDYLAVRGYDVYALDLRGMGASDHPADFSTIDVLARVQDASAVTSYIVASTGRSPVVMGWSQGGIIAGLLAASAPQLVSGVGLLSVAPDGFFVPPQFLQLIQSILASGVDRYLPDADVLYALAFSVDPLNGKPTISSDAFANFVASSDPDSVHAIMELFSPDFFNAAVIPAWPAIHVPALVVDGALDVIVGPDRAQELFNVLGSVQKQIIVYPRNAHAWFLEDNYEATWRAFDLFLSQF